MSEPLFEVGDVWRDDRAHRYGRRRNVMVTRISESGHFAYVVAEPSGRRTRIHEATMRRDYTLKHRLSWDLTGASPARAPEAR
jgi:hypothetical protein